MLAIASTGDGKWKRVNPAFRRTLGWSEHELLETPFLDIVHPDDLDRSAKATAQLAAETPLTNFEHRVRCKDGGYRWISWNTAAYPAEGLLYCVGRDISEERALQKRSRLAVKAARMGVFSRDLVSGRDYWSPELLSIFGLSPEDTLPMSDDIPAAVHPEDRQALLKEIEAHRHGGAGPEFTDEHRIVLPDGEVRWVMNFGRTEFDARGRPVEVHGVAADITSRKRAEEQHQKSAERLYIAAEAAALGVFEWDMETDTPRWINNRMYEIFGRAPGKGPLTLRELLDHVIHAEDRPALIRALRNAGGTDRLFRFVCRIYRENDGALRWVEYTGRFDSRDAENAQRLICVLADITERKEADEALRKSEELYRGIAANLPGGAVFIVDRDLRYVLAEGQALKEAGFDPAAFEGRNIWEALDKEMASAYDPFYRRALQGEAFYTEHESHGRYYVSQGVPIYTSEGAVDQVLAISFDITGRKQAEELVERNATLVAGINRIFNEALRADNIERLGEICLEVAEEITQSRISFIGELNSDTGLLAGVAISKTGWDAHRMALDFEIRGIHGRIMRDGRGFYTNEPASHPDSIGLPPGHPPLEAFLGVPLTRAGRVIGMVAVGNRPGGYGPDQLDALEALAPAILQALDRQRAEAGLRELTQTLEKQVAERTELAEARAKQLQTLAAELAEAEERERSRIARILHDDLQQLLASAQLRLQSIASGDAERAARAKIKDLLDEAIAKSRRLSHELSPSVLSYGDMADALQWLAAHMEKQFGLEVEWEAGPAASVAEPLRRLLFRAVRELLFNIVKHAQTNRAEVILSSEPDQVCITVRDDGRGFDPGLLGETADGQGYGLMAIRERIRYFGGSFAIDASPGRGSAFTLKVPTRAMHQGKS